MSEFKCTHCNQEFSTKEALDMHNNAKHYQAPKMKVNKRKVKNWGIFIGIVILIALGAYGLTWNQNRPGPYDDFAQCLTDNGVKMFGAYWCPHCQDQKKLFGRSFAKINYVECSLPNQGGQNQLCNDEGIESYPTWQFSDGTRQTGVVTLQQLSEKNGCELKSQ